MTDQELIDLLQQKSASEFTAAEIQQLRVRWTQSPELRQALVDHLQIESQLIGALAPVQLDLDAILQRASRQRRDGRRHWGWLIGFGLITLIGIGLALTFRTDRPQPIAISVPVPPGETEPSAPNRPVPVQDEPSADAAITAAEPDTHPDPPPTDVATAVAQAGADRLPSEPWFESLNPETVVWPADSPKIVADYKATGHDQLSEAQAQRWWSPVEGFPLNWATDQIGNPQRPIARLQGLCKLRAPWTDDAVLRLTPFDVGDLTLYFWHGPTGIAFRYYTRREPHLWAAFAISRENSSPRPTRWTLLTTDNGTYFRSTPGTFDVRVQQHQMVLARGGLVLMSVPCLGSPIEVFLEGQMHLRGCSMYRAAPFLHAPDSSHATILSGPAATLPWAISAESPSGYVTHEDGSISLTVDPGEKGGLLCLPFGWQLAAQGSGHAQGLFEALFQVDAADPGTGLFLGDKNGRPIHQIGFFRDAATQQVTFGHLRPGEVPYDSNFNRDDFPPPYLSPGCWLKLTAGLGTFHVQVSADGRHWGNIFDNPGRDWPGAVASLGLFGLKGPNSRTLKIRQITVRELTGITGLAQPELRRLIPRLSGKSLQDIASWTHHVLETQPGHVSPEDWFRAMAVATLSQGPPRDLGLEILSKLVDTGVRSKLTFERKRQLVDDALALTDAFDDGAARRFGVCYEQLGWQLASRGDPLPLATVRPAWLWSPIWTLSRLRNTWEPIQSYQILRAAYEQDWTRVWSQSQAAFYWNLPPHPDQRPGERGEELDRHARWARTLAAEQQPQLDDGTAGFMPLALRHPLLPMLNKEAYNVRAELQSALSGQSYEDAGRILTSVPLQEGAGLLPDADDRDLFVSMPTAIQSARAAHPGFVQVMNEKFNPVGQIRVTAAANRRDVTTLQAVTLQFLGTDAARDAHLWLGERALALGQFSVAEGHFHEGLTGASAAQRDQLGPRLLLARALSGRLTNDDVSNSPIDSDNAIELHGTKVTAVEFQHLLNDLQSRPTANGRLIASATTAADSLRPSNYKLEPRSQFDAHPGNNPGRGEFRFADSFGRQLAVATDSQSFFVNNRFQVNAYAIPGGQQIWAQGLGSEQGEAHGLPFTRMVPLIAGDRVYVRRLTKAGTELACLTTRDGQVVWHDRPTHSVLTDPMIWNGQLFAVILTRIDDDLVQVEAAIFEPTTGGIMATHPLFRLRDDSDRQFAGQLAIQDRLAVCSVAGTTACFDNQGVVRWLRRQTLLQRPTDERAEDFRVFPPVIQNGKVLISQSGVRELRCLDLQTGNSLWERPLVNLRGIIGLTENRVIADTIGGLTALDLETGEISWTSAIQQLLEGFVVQNDSLVISRRIVQPNGRSRPALIWLDPVTGRETAQSRIDTPEREECEFGPIVSIGGRWWAFVGSRWNEPKRELQELLPVNGPRPQSFDDNSLQGWNPRGIDALLAEMEFVVPGWFPVANYSDRVKLYPSDLRGELMVLISQIDSHHEVRMTAAVDRWPAARKMSLRLRVGNQPGQAWTLRVCSADAAIFAGDISDATTVNGWRDIQIELPDLPDNRAPLQLIQSVGDKAPAETLLKRAEFILAD